MKSELEAIMQTLMDTSYTDLQSIDQLIDYGFNMVGWIARTGQLMSEAKEQLHRKRRDAYKLAMEMLKDRKPQPSPLLVKDYVNDCCAEENALYELAERTNRACTHANDLIRTAVSALKQERFSAQF